MRPQPPFGTRVEVHDGVAVMALSGELDMATVPILRENLAPFEGNGVSTIRPRSPGPDVHRLVRTARLR
jgi:hypothetical protein